MKKINFSKFGITILVILFAFSISSCSVRMGTRSHSTTKKIPPGQAKKMSGSKSAKNYAPGHNK